MNAKRLTAVAAVLLIGGAAAGAMLYTGVGPAPGGTSGESIDDFPTEESAGGGDGSGPSDGGDGSGPSDGGDSESTTSGGTEPFTFTVDDTERCGTTCRDVTATLNNERNETATGVTTYIRIFAGESNTDTDDVVWEGTVDVGTLEADSSFTTTERVKLSLRGAGKVNQNDGWITIQTTVESDDRTVTFRESEKVA